jgi:SAM-dependent methyltransferase
VWLQQLGRSYRSIANFGCNVGQETLALMWLLDADEAVGVELDAACVEQAQRTIPNRIDSFRQQLFWAQQLHTYGEQLKLDNISFRLADMTKGTDLPANHYDLAFCQYVLNHIARDLSEQTSSDTLAAIQEMSRVVKPGGLIVAIEPENGYSGPLNLTDFFEQARLDAVRGGRLTDPSSPSVVYLYSKPEEKHSV